MKIAAFYENIKEGTKTAGVSMKQALTNLKETGLELLFVNYEVKSNLYSLYCFNFVKTLISY